MTAKSSPHGGRIGRLASLHVGFLENRGEQFGVWREPRAACAVVRSNLRRDPVEKSQHNSNTSNDWFLDRVLQQLAAKFLITGLSAEPDARLLQFGKA